MSPAPSAAPAGAPSTRWSISWKIFGISTALLALMIAVTILTSINFRSVGTHLAILSEYYVELDILMNEVRSETLREVLQIERVLHAKPTIGAATEVEAAALFKEARDCSAEDLAPVQKKLRAAYPNRAERRLMNYRLMRLCTNQRLDRASQVVDAALALREVQGRSEQVMRFTTIKNELANVRPAREKLHANFERYLTGLKTSDEAELVKAQERIDDLRGEVSRRIRAATRQVHAGTREAAQITRDVERWTRSLSWLVTFVACTLGLLFAALITRSLVRPVRELLGLTKLIRRGNLDVKMNITTQDEIGELADSFNHMVGELKQKEHIKQLFGKYVDPRVVQNLIASQQQMMGGGERQVMTVFFSDIEGFTSVCEGLTPTAMVRLLNAYFTSVAESIRAQSGIIDKYIGDSVMAFWGPPFCSSDQQATLACFAALAQQKELSRFRTTLPEILGIRRGVPTFNVRMSIATGDVTVGSIGSEDARSYTVIGDAVNLASRLESANKRYGTQILIDEETRRRAGESIEAREIDSIRVVGKLDAVRVYELLGARGEVDARTLELRHGYEYGLTQYRKRAFEDALEAFQRCLALDPSDAPARVFVERCRTLATQTVPDGWDGVYTFSEKH